MIGVMPMIQRTNSGNIRGLALLLDEIERLFATGRITEATGLLDEVQKAHPRDAGVLALVARRGRAR